MSRSQRLRDIAKVDPSQYVHHPGHEAEHLANEKVMPTFGGLKLDIYEAIEAAGDYGLTPDEFHAELPRRRDGQGRTHTLNSVRRAFTSLVVEGHIREHPDPAKKMRLNHRGNYEVVKVVGSDPNKVGGRLTRVLAELRETRAALRDMTADRDKWKARALRVKNELLKWRRASK